MSALTGSAVPSILLAMLLLLSGCSSPNDQSTFDSNTGKHIADWLPVGHMNAATANLDGCADCHGADFAGGISKSSCGDCHMGGATSVHPAGWVGDACYNHGIYAQSNGTAACANVYCHGPDLAGVAGSGPSCIACHTMPHAANCGSCHAIPPATGSHTIHMNSSVMRTVVCGSCHSSGCDRHDNGTNDVVISRTFYARSAGTVTFNGNTCTKVSCHGGTTTPNWNGGVINVNTSCTSCHAYNSGEYNSFSSGQHDLHVNGEGYACTDCHDVTLLGVNHFMHLETPAMEGPAWRTIDPSIQYDGTTCANPCHDPEQWR